MYRKPRSSDALQSYPRHGGSHLHTPGGTQAPRRMQSLKHAGSGGM